MPVARDWRRTEVVGPLECLDQDIDPHLLRQDRFSAREDHLVSRDRANKNCSPYISWLTSNWLWAIIRHASPFVFWNLHVAYVVCLQYLVAQR